MADRVRNTPGTEKTEATITPEGAEVLDNLQLTYEKNKKPITTAIIVIVAVVAGYIGYKKMYQEPRNEKAQAMMYYANKYFQMDSLNRALEGDGQHAGYLKVIKKYGGTDGANVSSYLAGVCYLRTGDYKNAIKYLKDFNGKGTLAEYSAYGALGDAYMGSGNMKEAAEYYEKAASKKDDELHAPTYLLRAGMVYEKMNKTEEAKKAYKKVRDEYPRSAENQKIAMYLARLGELE
jgi:TolA-binding protein